MRRRGGGYKRGRDREIEDERSRRLTGTGTDGEEGMVKWREDKNPEVR